MRHIENQLDDAAKKEQHEYHEEQEQQEKQEKKNIWRQTLDALDGLKTTIADKLRRNKSIEEKDVLKKSAASLDILKNTIATKEKNRAARYEKQLPDLQRRAERLYAVVKQNNTLLDDDPGQIERRIDAAQEVDTSIDAMEKEFTLLGKIAKRLLLSEPEKTV